METISEAAGGQAARDLGKMAEDRKNAREPGEAAENRENARESGKAAENRENARESGKAAAGRDNARESGMAAGNRMSTREPGKVLWEADGQVIRASVKKTAEEIIAEKSDETFGKAARDHASVGGIVRAFEENAEAEEAVAEDDVQYRAWLLREKIRMESERKMIELQKEELLRQQQKLAAEKKAFDQEMKKWADKIHCEKTRMEQERSFFDAKFKLLENGFKQLAAEKEQFAYEKKMFETMKKVNRYHDEISGEETDFGEGGYVPVFFFKGVTSSLGVKKRYKDLIKIFHPDNLFGDHDTILKINKEYEMMKKKFNYQKKTV